MSIKILRYRVTREYREFRKRMLRKSKKELWSSCHIIFFYCNIYEYILYNQNLSEESVRALSFLQNPIAQLWDIYLKEETLSVSTWSDIDEIVASLMERIHAFEQVFA